MLDVSFLGGVEARTGRCRGAAAEAKGISTEYYWTGKGRDALEVSYGTAVTKPNATAVREMWKQRHGRAAAPLLVVVGYPKDRPNRAVVCGPAGKDPPVVELDHIYTERLAAAALGEPSRHLAIRFLADALEGDPDEKPGLRNKGLLATHELLYGVPKRSDWEAATERSRPLLGLQGQDLERSLGYEIEPQGRLNVLRASGGRARAVAVFLQDTVQADQPSSRFENQTPVTYALAHADRDNLPWVVAVRSGTIDPTLFLRRARTRHRFSASRSRSCWRRNTVCPLSQLSILSPPWQAGFSPSASGGSSPTERSE